MEKICMKNSWFQKSPAFLKYFGIFFFAWISLFSCSKAENCDVTALAPSLTPGEFTEVMLPMRDCVRLATDVYVPPGGTSFPAILIRLPYSISGDSAMSRMLKVMTGLFRTEGYAVIAQECRGRYSSEGEWYPLLHEAPDGLDTVRWIERQPWFNGRLGMAGGSYFGYTQIAVASQKPASLKAIAPLVTFTDIYSLLFHHGLPRADITAYWAPSMRERDNEYDLPDDDFLSVALHWPLIEGDDATVGDIPWLDDFLRHPLDDGFYDGYLPSDVIGSIEAPMFMVSGWWDLSVGTQLDDFERAQARPDAGGRDRIIVGPWTHYMGFAGDHDLEFPAGGSLAGYFPPMLEWFAALLKDGTMPASLAPVTIYDPGKDAWLDRPALWSPNRVLRRFYLNGTQSASTCAGPGGLGPAPPAEAASISYTYDPGNPILNLGGNYLMVNRAGCREQPDLCGRGDVVVFQTDPLEADLTLEGDSALKILVSSSAPDTAFISRLSLIRPGGKAYSLREGVMTLSHREGDDRAAPYSPEEVVALQIEFPPLLWTFHSGEALRLEIMSSSLPAVAQHPNVDHDWFLTADPLPAVQTLHLLPENPAYLELQISQ